MQVKQTRRPQSSKRQNARNTTGARFSVYRLPVRTVAEIAAELKGA